MARPQSWNPVKLTAELSAADSAINPLLEASKITSIKVNGADVAASEAPLPDRIKAYSDVVKAGATSADAVELASLNGQITAQLEKVQGELSLAQSSVATLTQSNTKLSNDLATEKASTAKLTADNAELGNRNTVLTGQLEASAGRENKTKLNLARKCLNRSVIEFKGADGKALAANCSDADLALASKELSYESMSDSYDGAVNSALTKLGTNIVGLPAAPASTSTSAPVKKISEMTGLAKTSAAFAAQIATK